ncbi:unnamed protein product [Symbiodinium natans]|uniref:Uncharacterized protein n=1 Tax=Symbiodinium natans TaxID=878477 RepID=A0A812LHE1_9DINO|nr:unnamed protein product [Symbiodinium natans]
MAPAHFNADPHWELIRQVAAADARAKRAGRRNIGIPSELSVPVLAAVAVALRQERANEMKEAGRLSLRGLASGAINVIPKAR